LIIAERHLFQNFCCGLRKQANENHVTLLHHLLISGCYLDQVGECVTQGLSLSEGTGGNIDLCRSRGAGADAVSSGNSRADFSDNRMSDNRDKMIRLRNTYYNTNNRF
jgi:hypothetical protein